MIRNENTILSYSLRNALLLTAYGIYGILMLPRIFSVFDTQSHGGVVWVVRIVILVLYLSYIFLGMTGLLMGEKVKSNHKLIKLLFIIIFLDCTFLGFYLLSRIGFETASLITLGLSSAMIAGVMVYCYIIFQIKEQSIYALRTMSATMLFFSGGGEIFYHHMPYINTIMGWFMIWMALNCPDRPLLRSFIYSIVGSMIFFIPRFSVNGTTLVDVLKNFLIENQIPPLYSFYVTFGLVFIIVLFLLRIKLNSFKADSKDSTDVVDIDAGTNK